MRHAIKSNKRKKNILGERINFAFMQKIHLLMKNTLNRGFCHCSSRFGARVTFQKGKILNKGRQLLVTKKTKIGLING